MAAPVIFISSDSSMESVGSHASRVILFGTIPTSILVIPAVPDEVLIAPTDPLVALKVGAISVILPTRVLDLVDYSSSSDSDPSEDSFPVATELPLVSPFLCTDDSKVDSESEPAKQRPKRHESLTPSSEFPLAFVAALPGIRRRPAILIRPGEAILFGQPYRTHSNGPRKLLIARKRVGPFLARKLGWRRVSHRSLDCHSSPDFTSNSSSPGSSSDSSSDISSRSSLGLLSDSSSVHSSGQSHSGPSTRVASPRLVDPSVCTLSTLYPPKTSESSPNSSSKRSLDLSSPSAVPSLKRCGSPTILVSSSTSVSRLIAPALVDLPSHLGISDGVRAPTKDGLCIGVKVATSDIREDEEEFEAEASTRDTMEIVVDPLVTGGISKPIEGDTLDLEERAGLADRVKSLGWENLRVRYLLCIERDRVDSLRHHMELSQEEFCQIHRDRDDTQRRLRRLESLVERQSLETREANRNIRLGNGNDKGGNGNDNGNRNGGGNGNGNHNENDRDTTPVVRELFHISNCLEKYQVKYATCTLLNSALTWWNSHKRTIGTDAAFAMSWRELMKLIDEVFQELTMLYTKMVLKEEDRVEKFIRGLLDNIQENVIAA
uniref:Reverse transcriptase domain-containing protein n=1 Tax=Tanacetum cinerariifolium TaxID=118510 RepID=A0A6L2L9I6_TANCI|nr:hypothetical protein [Tanacetum cinerariifolium]